MMKSLKKVFLIIIFHSVFGLTIQLLIAHLGTKISLKFLKKHHFYFRSFNFERRGEIWNQYFKVSQWERWIPEGSKLNHNIYDKGALTHDLGNTRQLLLEMKRTEFIHWISILPVIVFIKAPKYIKVINVLYVFLSHLPIIITQRYNRPRIERLMRLMEKRGR